MQGRRKRGGWGGFSSLPPVFGQTVNLSQPGGQIIPTSVLPAPPPDFQTLRRACNMAYTYKFQLKTTQDKWTPSFIDWWIEQGWSWEENLFIWYDNLNLVNTYTVVQTVSVWRFWPTPAHILHKNCNVRRTHLHTFFCPPACALTHVLELLTLQ